MAKAVGAWPRPWGRGQGLEGVAKAMRANPNLTLRPWRRS